MFKFNPENPAPFTDEIVLYVRRRLAEGWFQHVIAAELGWNQGRVSEINTGKRGVGVQQQLPL
ncbi:hypothetical protein CHU93_15005 [Sandarakinorhabdus cyanobacteriorum]|uniref:XRE family transcriptional regulator n=1 Tax=Sandarakinorhabdus cyanobacteriorum TaxID=1981098 RepID=A0A255Y682_9SPHN|nr:hypothetical protein [Sandarakinorhabdus cyanobacteriorum]OYQ24671.1 hypothetical protein CHU93_15005 [Sandarakinorhabdus cyanobacteriorum]